jgi:hypothetical protein
MATKSEIPKEAGVAPSERPNLKQNLTDSEGPSIAPDNACDEPAPEAPGGAGKEAIRKDAKTGGGYDKVYGVRPTT